MIASQLFSSLLVILYLSESYQLITKQDEREIRQEIRNLINAGASQAHPLMAGCVRLIFHDCVGGVCNGCVDLTDSNNGGLQKYLDQLDLIDRSKWGISQADLWVLCAFESILLGAEITPPTNGVQPLPTDMVFMQGREDLPGPCPRLTFPDSSADPVPFLIKNFPGLDEELAVALMGAHTLGKAHSDVSGYSNNWVIFANWCDNEYYKDMINTDLRWTMKERTSPVGELLYQWTQENGQHLMLHCDMALWMINEIPDEDSISLCGYPGTSEHTCAESPHRQYVHNFAEDNALWMEKFQQAMMIMVNSGQTNLKPVE